MWLIKTLLKTFGGKKGGSEVTTFLGEYCHCQVRPMRGGGRGLLQGSFWLNHKKLLAKKYVGCPCAPCQVGGAKFLSIPSQENILRGPKKRGAKKGRKVDAVECVVV